MTNKLSIVEKKKNQRTYDSPILLVLSCILLAAHQPRMGSISDWRSVQSCIELMVRKMLISSTNKKISRVFNRIAKVVNKYIKQ